MKRRLLVLLLIFLTLVATALPAFADVVWVPKNDFHRKHQEECVYHNRDYLTNGENGYVTVKTAPNSYSEVTNLVNGTRFCVEYIWTEEDGTQWGIGSEAGKYNAEKGWVKLSDLSMVYDYICFEEDHGHEFADYDGSGDELEKAYVYTYPGGVFCGYIKQSKSFKPFAEAFQYLYTDENGLRWTYVKYYIGEQNCWLCIDDPMNDELGAGEWESGYRTVNQVRAETDNLVAQADSVPTPKTWLVWVISTALILIVVVVTAVIVRRQKRKTV